MKPEHNRAAQFAPFAALSGFEEVVRRRREIPARRRTLAADEIFRLNEVLSSLALGDTVGVTYYKRDRYLNEVGILTDLDPTEKTLTLVKTVIPFSDLYDVRKITDQN